MTEGLLVGPYRLLRELGRGGMGAVFLAAVDSNAALLPRGSRVALKLVHPHLLATPGFFKRFLREAEIGKSVRHENVVRTLDVDATAADGAHHHFLVMEYVEGQTLRELLAEAGRVPEELCRHIGREVAAGLAAIHAAGVIHRDLKPENVLVTKDHVVKVMDLGVARLADETMRLSQTGAFVGSMHYAAPEQFGAVYPKKGGAGPLGAASGATGCTGTDLDGRADLHALGLILYELATAHHPYDGDDFRRVMRRVLDEKPRRPAEINPQLTPFFEELVLQLLAKDREARVATALELARILAEGESSDWWKARAKAIRTETRRPLRRVRVPRETALYGRGPELAKLRALYAKAKEGDGQFALVEGEAGIGKSRLVDEFVALLQREGEDLNFLYGGYMPGGAATASGAFSTAYREHFGDADLDATLAPYLAVTPKLVPAFAALLRGETTPAGVEPLTKDSLQTVFVHATRALAAERVTVILIDDLHFAPEEGRALFAALATAVPGHRALLLGSTRPGLDEAWLSGIERMGGARIAPPRLGAKDLVHLLMDTLRSERLAEELVAKIALKSDGNPYFVFEILRGMREGEFITRNEDGTWVGTRAVEEIRIPSSILELVQARVADLDETDRDVLDVASCLGFEFDPLLVGAVLEIAQIPLMRRLAQIEKKRRLVRSAGRRFLFDHHQVQEALYSGMPELLREPYHAAIAEAIERRHGAAEKDPATIDGSVCVELAEHFLSGRRGDCARRYVDAALDHLEKGYLNGAAVRLGDLALAAPGLYAGEERCGLLHRKVGRLGLLGRREAQSEAFAELRPLAAATGDDAVRARAEQAYGWHLFGLSREKEAEPILAEALALARAAGDKRVEAAAANGLGAVCLELSRPDEARAHFERHLALSCELGDRRGEGRATGNLGNVYESLGQTEKALALHERALALTRADGDRLGETIATGNVGLVCRALGRLADAFDHAGRHLGLAREIGYRHGEGVAAQRLGLLHRAMGAAAAARAHFERRLALARETADPRGEGHALAELVKLAAQEDDVALAELHHGEFAAVQRRIGRHESAAATLVAVGALYARRGRTDEARRRLTEAQELAKRSGAHDAEILALAHLAGLPGGEAAAAQAAFAAHEPRLAHAARMEACFLLWRATREASHLVEAKRLLAFLVDHAPADRRRATAQDVPLHREIGEARATD